MYISWLVYGHSEKLPQILYDWLVITFHLVPHCLVMNCLREKDLRLLCLNKSLRKSHAMGFLPTVGRISASIDMVNIPLFTGFHSSIYIPSGA